jgi:hypothetical protein
MNSRFLALSLAAALTGSLAADTAQTPPPAQTGTQQQGRGGQAGGRGQQPARDTQAAPVVGTGVIAGVVVTEGSGTPVRRARVNLSASELRGGRSTMTTDEGKFSFGALPAGRYTLSASKPGYVNITFGAKRPGRPGTPIQLVDAGKMENAAISLPRGAVVTGVVMDEHGEASPGTQVRVMRFVMRTGERTLEQAGQDQTDDRGIYRIFGLQPGDYIVNASPRNTNVGDMQQQLRMEIEALVQQAQAMGAAAGGGRGGGAAGGGGGGRAGRGGDPLVGLMGGGRGQALLDRAAELQAQIQGQQPEQPVAYAPVFYPGTTAPATASTVSLGVGEERAGIDFQLQLVPTARVEGIVQSADGVLPQGTQITLVSADQSGGPGVPGFGTSSARADQTGRFVFSTVNPGQYRVTARAPVRQIVDPAAAPTAAGAQAGRGGFAPGGQGGRGGGRGQVVQVLWASADVSVNGQNITDLVLALQPGMTVSGRVSFEGSILPPPADLTQMRVNLSPRGQQQGMDVGIPPAQVDASGRFTITGVGPGKYSLNANIAGGGRGAGAGAAAAAGGAGGRGGTGAAAPQWILKSAVTPGGDALDFGLVVEPNQDVSATLTFVDRTQEISGSIQDPTGKPTADFTIILFAADKRFWVPQARRIRSSRPGTDGKFSFTNIPPGDYRLTAVTDVEPGEWFNPEFLSQLVGSSVPVTLVEGERKTQDIRVAGGV